MMDKRMVLKNKQTAVEVNPQKCIGCYCCTLACSFHHTRTFFPEDSSIDISFDGKGAIHTKVLPSCDLCLKEKRPLCIEFCPVGAVSLLDHPSSR
jgi:Fe-S-cluster-containing hydrogenase component 2